MLECQNSQNLSKWRIPISTASEQSRKGQISIHTENIFPIIKKWLYSEHDIFIRELVSNAYDAINKRNAITRREGLESVSPKIKLTIDETAKTLTISDNGLGMDADEIEKYINQIAFSGAEEFLKKYEGQEDKQIIGHFGLGFYSSFMVSTLVEINTLSYKAGATAVRWRCDGSTEFEIIASERAEVGTDIVLHLNEESLDYLKEEEVSRLVKKYANFIPAEITVGDTVANNQNPLWVKSPNDVTEDEYKAFYRTLFPTQFAEPLFWIHLNVDYPFNLKGILYFPKLMHELDANKGQVHLYCQQVFVSDSAKEVVPEFLNLLQGAIDCPDLPLNVSRSFLQRDPYVQKISKHIVKKIADRLNELFKQNRSDFETYWEDIHPFIKYGIIQHQDFYDKVKDIVIFASSNNAATTVPEYLSRNEEKLGKKILYCSNKETQATYVKLCQEQGLEVIYLKSAIDSHFIQFLESKDSEVKYVSVDAAVMDHLLDSEAPSSDIVDPETNKTSKEKLADYIKETLKKDSLTVKVEALKSQEIPAVLVQDEYMKRLQEMSMFMKTGNAGFGLGPETLVINTQNPLIQSLQKLSGDSSKAELSETICQHVYDLARMAHAPLSGDDLQTFLTRSASLMARLV